MRQKRNKKAKHTTESSRRDKRAALRSYLRQNNWIVLLACLCVVALVLLILVLAGGKTTG